MRHRAKTHGYEGEPSGTLDPLYSSREDTLSKAHGQARRSALRPGTLSFSARFPQEWVISRNTRQCEDVLLSSRDSSYSRGGSREAGSSGRNDEHGADDPESCLWTFTNASTLPAGVTTRVCTGGERVPPLPFLSPPPGPPPSASRPLPQCTLSRLSIPFPLFVLLRAPSAPSPHLSSRSCGPPRGEAGQLDSPVNLATKTAPTLRASAKICQARKLLATSSPRRFISL